MRALDRWKSRRVRSEASSEALAPVPASPPEVCVATLRTVHDTSLSVKGVRLDQTRRAGGRARLLWEPGSGIGLLVGEGASEEFGLGPATPRALGHLVRLDWRSASTVAVGDLWTRTWLSPAPVDGEPGTPRMRPGVTAIGSEETLELEPSGAGKTPGGSAASAGPGMAAAAVVYVQARDLWQGAGVRAADVLAALVDPDASLGRAAFSTMLPLLSRDDLVELAQNVVADDTLVAALADLFPTDPWTTRSLPDLRAWIESRGTAVVPWHTRKVGTELDVLWSAGPGDVAASSGEVVAFYARGQVRPRRRVCVVATARNEGIYLLEWLAYHRALGVDEFFVYSNNNDDGSDRLLSALAEAGLVRWLDSEVGPGTKAQAKAYAHAFSVLPDVLDFQWAVTVDIDEFLVLDPARFDGLADFLDWHTARQTDVIAVNWVVVGPSGLTGWADDLVTRRFPSAVSPVDAHIKSISRPGRVLGSQPHFPYTAERERLAFREATGELHTWFTSTLAPHLVQAQSDHPSTGHAALHHYALKSAEEFLWKFSRNRGGRVVATDDEGMALTLEERFVKRFLAQFGQDAGDVRPAVEATVPHLEREIEELRRHEGVAEAERQVKEIFVERSARVLEAYRTRLRDDLGDSGRELLRILDEEGIAHV